MRRADPGQRESARMIRMLSAIALALVCGCHDCVWQGPLKTVGRDGSQHALDLRQLCGDARSGRPIRPGVPRRTVSALLGSTACWDQPTVDYELHAPAVF